MGCHRHACMGRGRAYGVRNGSNLGSTCMFLHAKFASLLADSPLATTARQHVHACACIQESLRLAHLPPPPPLLSPAGEAFSEPEVEEDLSDMQSDDEDDQLSRLLQVCSRDELCRAPACACATGAEITLHPGCCGCAAQGGMA